MVVIRNDVDISVELSSLSFDGEGMVHIQYLWLLDHLIQRQTQSHIARWWITIYVGVQHNSLDYSRMLSHTNYSLIILCIFSAGLVPGWQQASNEYVIICILHALCACQYLNPLSKSQICHYIIMRVSRNFIRPLLNALNTTLGHYINSSGVSYIMQIPGLSIISFVYHTEDH